MTELATIAYVDQSAPWASFISLGNWKSRIPSQSRDASFSSNMEGGEEEVDATANDGDATSSVLHKIGPPVAAAALSVAREDKRAVAILDDSKKLKSTMLMFVVGRFVANLCIL